MPQEKLITLDNLETFKDKLDVRVNKLVAFNDQNLADNPDVTLTSETPVKIASFDATVFDSLPSTFYFKAEIVERYNEINIVRHYKDGTPSVSGRYPLYSGGVNTFDVDNTDNNIASVDIEGFAGTYFNMMFCINQNAVYTPYYLSNRQLTHEIRNVSGLELGETSTTAYRGDRGKTAYDHSQSLHARTDATKTESGTINGNIKINGTETTVYTHPGSGTNPHGTTKADVGLGNVGNFKAVSTVASQGLTSTEQSNARANIGAGTSNLTIGTTATTAAAGNHTHTAANVGAIATSARGAANGVAELDANGKVPLNRLPSYAESVSF